MHLLQDISALGRARNLVRGSDWSNGPSATAACACSSAGRCRRLDISRWFASDELQRVEMGGGRR
jgi:hypothetical protein